MRNEVRDTILEAMEQGLDAQLRALRRLRKAGESAPEPRPEKRKSQITIAYDILLEAPGPLHVNEILECMRKTFGVEVDRESLVSSLTKKVARGDRFVRTGRNTFGLKGGM